MNVASNRYGVDMTCGDTWMDFEDGQHECGREVNHEGVCCCGKCGRVRLERRVDAPLLPLVIHHDVPETHAHGHCSVENLEAIMAMDLQHCDVGYQISYDGRVWLCVNGVAFIRFKPDRSEKNVKPLHGPI